MTRIPTHLFPGWTLLLGLVAIVCGPLASHAAPRDFPRPAELEQDVAFWKRIYSEVGTDAGLIHDTRDLSLIYEVTRIPAGLSSRARERHTERRKKHFKEILLELASGKRSGLSSEERRVLALFDAGVSNQTLRSAAGRLRFQLGQANKFRAGVIRSGAYKPHILQTLREMNLPDEIAHLPHVESSYTPTVYSRVGAAGLWQFTRSTGRRFMQVDHVVDERLDPYRASLAAARLLEQNFRVTGTWPLAITAYNHGASGMRRAAQKLGTKNITRIVREYRSRTFGFASRNFYVEFLAADAVASNAEFYFGPLVLDQPVAYEAAELPYYARPKDLAQALGVHIDTLKEANPALRPAVWRGSKHIPKGFKLRVPRATLPRPLRDGLAALPQHQRLAQQTRDTTYTVRRGDTLSTIARRHRVKMTELVALNGLRSRNRIRIGQKLKLPPDTPSGTRTAAYTPPPPRPDPPAAARKSAAAAVATTPAALPASGFYTVRRGDNLTRIAERFGLDVPELVALNDLRSRNRIHVGQRLRVARDAVIAQNPSTAESDAAEPAPIERPATAPEMVLADATADAHPDAPADLSATRDADAVPDAGDLGRSDPDLELAADDIPIVEDELSDGSPVEPSPGLLADPSDYTVASNGTIIVQPNETLGHFAEWLGLRASRLRQINGMRYGEPVVVQQRLRLDFSSARPEDFERVRVEYHREIQEEFFAEWEIEDTVVHEVGSGDSLWVLSTRRFKVPIWLLRQYNPDLDLDAIATGMKLTVPRLRHRTTESSAVQTAAREAATS